MVVADTAIAFLDKWLFGSLTVAPESSALIANLFYACWSFAMDGSSARELTGGEAAEDGVV